FLHFLFSAECGLHTSPLLPYTTLFRSENLVVRFAAADQLVERIGSSAAEPVEALIGANDISGRAYIHALWVLHRLDVLSTDLINRSATHSDPLVRLHTMRILLEVDLDTNTHL